MALSKKLICEFIGTFTLIFIGVSSIVVNAGLVGVAIAHGLAIGVMVAAMGYISGGFFNPAVTLGALVGGKISASDAAAYWVAQLLGATVAAFAVNAIFPAPMVDAVTFGAPTIANNIGMGGAILMEFILTFFLVLVVYGAAIDGRGTKLAPLFIGLTITIGVLAGGPITGAALNPARAFGPALANGFWKDQIVYWIGPLAGGLAAGLLWSKVLGEKNA
jgi:aquaporin Z